MKKDNIAIGLEFQKKMSEKLSELIDSPIDDTFRKRAQLAVDLLFKEQVDSGEKLIVFPGCQIVSGAIVIDEEKGFMSVRFTTEFDGCQRFEFNRRILGYDFMPLGIINNSLPDSSSEIVSDMYRDMYYDLNKKVACIVFGAHKNCFFVFSCNPSIDTAENSVAGPTYFTEAVERIKAIGWAS